MANIKSQKKRIVTSENARLANKSKKSRIATEIRKFREQVKANEFAQAEESLKTVFSLIDRARLDNVYHVNTASRKKANLARELHNAKTAQN
ncbi:MAG: 30S ribosomal protein S20 [Clostridia bacterium]|nr:30S ribosomal protein S20 [Clostridia bacterium]